MRIRAWLIAFLACGAVSLAGTESTLYFLNGDSSSGVIEGGEGSTLLVRTVNFPDPVRIDAKKLRKIVFANDPVEGPMLPMHTVHLDDGTSVTGKLQTVSADAAVLVSEYCGKMKLDRRAVLAITTSRDFRPMSAPKRDTLTLSNGDRVTGDVAGVAEGKLTMSSAFGEIRPTLELVAAVTFAERGKDAKRPPRKPGWSCKARLTSGDSFIGEPVALGAEAIALKSDTAGEIRLRTQDLSLLLFSDKMSFVIGHTLIVEYGRGRIIIVDEKGKTIWTKDGLTSPTRAQRLDNGNILFVEQGRRNITEVNSGGKTVWSRLNVHAYDAKRLPDGSTLYTDTNYGRVILLDPDGDTVWHRDGFSEPVYIDPLPDGSILIAASNLVREITPTGETTWETSHENNPLNRPYSAQRLDNGNTLVAEYGAGRVVEIDKGGAVAWQKAELQKPFSAQRLDNGNTLIAEYSAGRVIEVDPEGKVVWQVLSLTNPTQAVRF